MEEKKKREVDLEERDKQLELFKSEKVAAEEKFESDRARMEEELRKLKSQLEANEVDKDLKEKAYQEKMKEMNMRMEAELQKEREKLTKKCKELEKKVRVFEEGEKKHLEDLEELKGVANADQAKITELEEEVKKLEGFKETAGELIYGAGSQILVRLWFVIGFWPPTPNTTDTQQLTHILFIVDMIIQYQCKKLTLTYIPPPWVRTSVPVQLLSVPVSLSVAVPVSVLSAPAPIQSVTVAVQSVPVPVQSVLMPVLSVFIARHGPMIISSFSDNGTNICGIIRRFSAPGCPLCCL